MKHLIILYFMCSTSIFALPQGIESIIQKSTIPKDNMAIYIKEVGKNGLVLASLNASTLKTPASVIKVLTTYAAVLKLGFNYHFPTKFYITGKVNNGVVEGDLVVKGFGDPTLNSKNLDKIVEKIKAKGIRGVTGNIVIDRSYFRVSTKNSSGFDEHPHSAYNAMPDAMMFNERLSTICVQPKKNSAFKKDVDGSYKIINQLKIVNKPCRGKYSWPGVKIDSTEATPKVFLRGNISKRCGQQNICKVITKPYLSFYYAFKDKLKKVGISVEGNMRLRKVPQNARPLLVHYSQSLEKIVSKTAKKSNNLYARHLLLFLGANIYGAPATVEKGRKAVEKILRVKGALSQKGLKIDNGSGLSRTARLSAKMLVDMYDDAYSRYGERWMQTLSIAGVDGTIKKRFRGTIVKNRAWMKTGTLKRTKNIGGYVKSMSGKLYEVVILVQSKRGNWRASQLQNEILKWLVKYDAIATSVTQKQATNSVKNTVTFVPETTTKYYVQAGALNEIPTKKYLQKIEKLNLMYKVKYSKKHRVLVGPYGREKDARKALIKVRKYINSKAFVTKL